MSIADALSRISQIQQQLADLSASTLSATATSATGGSSATAAADTGAVPATDTTSATDTDFADALAQAQAAATTQDSASTEDAGTTADGTLDAASTLDAGTTAASFPSLADSALGEVTDTGSGLSDQAITALGLLNGSTGGVALTTGVSLPATASSMMTSGQRQFAQALAADTGLNPGVVSAWVLSEESGSAAQTRQAQGNNDWLNVGYTGSGDEGTTDAIWSDPGTAAAATAGWLKGEDSVPGYGTASAGIQAILQTVGDTPQAQLAALQGSGWASSGYPDLSDLYAEVSG
jgi:hypothetical protein